VLLAGCGGRAAPRPLPRVAVHGGALTAGGKPLRVFGFNWGVGDRQPVLDYFDHPTPAALRELGRQLDTARALGANVLRIPLEFGQVMQSPHQPRRTTLLALRRLLAAAAARHIYLDIAGNLVWRPSRAPVWYAGLPEAERWAEQVRFWWAVAGVAHASPAVLCYELTSEPEVADDPAGGYYRGPLGGFRFLQVIAFAGGRDPAAVARAWTARLAAAVRSRDDRPVTIGLLPRLHGAFAPADVAGLLDLLSVHVYPRDGHAAGAAGLVRSFAGVRRPVLLGETFPLRGGLATERAFLTAAAPSLAGALGFFDGRTPAAARAADPGYAAALAQFAALRPLLAGPPRR
jgi:hypothetical protein